MTSSERPLRPESYDIRSRSGGTGPGSSSAQPDARSSPPAFATSERLPEAELRPAFQRRWEVVQTVFVAQARRGRKTDWSAPFDPHVSAATRR
jgi:hypothetical protein